MEHITRNILITGLPGVGKTTLIRKLSTELKDYFPVGFYTSEIREKGERKGFQLIDLNGNKAILSHVSIQSPHRVGRYGVDVKGFDKFLDSISFLDPAGSLIILDEIGKMECFSQKFKNLLPHLLASPKLLLATIALRGGGVIQETRNRKDITLFEITRNNRSSLFHELVHISHSLLLGNDIA